LTQLFGAGVLRPSNSSGRVSRIPHALISSAPASRRKLLVAAYRVVFAFEMWYALSCGRSSFVL